MKSILILTLALFAFTSCAKRSEQVTLTDDNTVYWQTNNVVEFRDQILSNNDLIALAKASPSNTVFIQFVEQDREPVCIKAHLALFEMILQASKQQLYAELAANRTTNGPADPNDPFAAVGRQTKSNKTQEGIAEELGKPSE